MAGFICTPLRDTDAAGNVTASGLYWNEGASGRTVEALIEYWLLAFFGGAAAAVLLFIGWLFGWWLAMGAVPFLWLMGWALRIIFSRQPERSVVFHGDGSIAVPLGLPRDREIRELAIRQEDVASIEVGPSLSGLVKDWSKTIVFITRYGQTLTVGFALHELEAREVAVRLSLALKEMRGARVETAASSAPGPATSGSDVID